MRQLVSRIPLSGILEKRHPLCELCASALSKLSFNLFPNAAQTEERYDDLYSIQSVALTAGKRSAADR